MELTFGRTPIVTRAFMPMVAERIERWSGFFPAITALCAVLTLLIVCGSLVAAANGAFSSETTHARDQYQMLAGQMSNLAEQVKEGKVALNNLAEKMPRADQIAGLAQSIVREDGRIDQLTSQVNQQQNALTDLRRHVDDITQASREQLPSYRPK